MEQLEWKRVDDHWDDSSKPEGYTYRAKVPGGWLVSVWAGSDKKQAFGGGMTFLPDPTYGWADIVGNKK
jgi:hypothetical protein